MEKLISIERRNYLLDYKLNNNKSAFHKLVLSYLDNIKNIVSKYEN